MQNDIKKNLISAFGTAIAAVLCGLLGYKFGKSMKDGELEEAHEDGKLIQLKKDEEYLIENDCIFFNAVKCYTLGMAVYSDAKVSTEPNCLTNLREKFKLSVRPADYRYFRDEADKHLSVEHAIADYSQFLSSLSEANKKTCLALTNTFMQQLADELQIPVNTLWSNFIK